MRQTIIKTKLLCPICRNITTICRKEARKKKIGHLKKLYCYKCKTTHNHIELKENYNYTNEEIENLIFELLKEK